MVAMSLMIPVEVFAGYGNHTPSICCLAQAERLIYSDKAVTVTQHVN